MNIESQMAISSVEDPLYQAVVAAISQLVGLPLTAGRTIANLPSLPSHTMSREASEQYTDAWQTMPEIDVNSVHKCVGKHFEGYDYFGAWCKAYIALFLRLNLPAGEVGAYVQRERRLLAQLYFAAREPVPSPDKLKRFAIQLAVDVRRPIEGNLKRFKQPRASGGWRLRVVQLAAEKATGLPHADGNVTKFSPLVPDIFFHVFQSRPNAIGLVSWIEGIYGRAPELQDTLESAGGNDAAEDHSKPPGGDVFGSGTDEVPPAAPRPPKPPEPLPDGPFDPNGFRFRGAEVFWGKAVLQSKLTLALWDKQSRRPRPAREHQVVIEEVYGDEDEIKEATFRGLISDTRGTYQKAQLALNIMNVQGKIWLVELPE